MKEPVTADPLEVLHAHNLWATRRVLELCRGLTKEQFHQSFPIGPGERGGLHATLTHIISAMRRWADRIAEREVRPSLEKPPPGWTIEAEPRERTVEELLELLEEAAADLRTVGEEAMRRGLEGVITMQLASPQGPKSYRFTRGASLTHALTHGHYHRSQCMNMLRQLGMKDLPDLDVCDWQWEVECGAE
jgi:uncharacterized damage-inducible protein DinB